MKTAVFWFRRDLRLVDNVALSEALSTGLNIIPIFIFDDDILNELPSDDPRVNFIYDQLQQINEKLNEHQSSILILKGKPIEVWAELVQKYPITAVYANKDYEPYAIQRDKEIAEYLQAQGIVFFSFKDQVIHEESEVLKNDGNPYTVFTPYKNKWLDIYQPQVPRPSITFEHFHKHQYPFPPMAQLGIQTSAIKVKDFDLGGLDQYGISRDFPHIDATSYLGPHLRFGTVNVRQIIAQLEARHNVFMSELIWREFFMQILFHFPHVVSQNFKAKYDGIQWLNNTADFERWCTGQTGYAMVDAGMRQLNATGYMHNRVRMITAGFLCKHLLIDWRWGESYFARKLLDYELSSNNGNWQWAAGTGCDAAPYFRIFNPMEQQKKFDQDQSYVRKWIPEIDTLAYPNPMIDHKYARQRALERYKVGIQ